MSLSSELKQMLKSKTGRSLLSSLYMVSPSQTDTYAQRYFHLIETFESEFGQNRDIRLFSTPGRTEICGNHTDHQCGHVLAASVNLDIIAAASCNNTKIIHLRSEGYDPVSINLTDFTIHPEEKNTTASLVRGIAAAFSALGYSISGFDVCLSSNVLKGSGLSSSAAFEVIIGMIINSLFCQKKETDIKIAQIGQYAENTYFGKPSGLMDQVACSVGGFVTIDFVDPKNPLVKKVDFDFSASGYVLCIVDTGGSHADLTSDYASIPKEMGSIAQFFGKEVLSQVEESLFYQNIASLRQQCGDRAVLRAIHFYHDNNRVLEEVKALSENQFDSFKQLVLESGLSSSQHLQNVYSCSNPQEQGIPLALALCQKVLGQKGAYRVQGGGFAGTIQAFVPSALLNLFQETIEPVFGKESCHILSIRPIGGIELIF